jgi:hypothetical protein
MRREARIVVDAKKAVGRRLLLKDLMDGRRIELLTSALRTPRSPS